MTTTHEMKSLENGYVYLLHRHDMDQNIYKIGRTHHLKDRLASNGKGYDKGSFTIKFFRSCDYDSKLVERKIIKLFKRKYIQRTEYGNEYFQGDYAKMESDIFALAKLKPVKKQQTHEIIIISDSETEEEYDTDTDAEYYSANEEEEKEKCYHTYNTRYQSNKNIVTQMSKLKI
jgi:hypothetical protein